MYWYYHTSAGEIRIVERKSGCFAAVYNNAHSRCFQSPQAVAHSIRDFNSGCDLWDSLYSCSISTPNELNEWNRHS